MNNRKSNIVENILPCCKRCNIAKASMYIDKFKEHIQKIYVNAPRPQGAGLL